MCFYLVKEIFLGNNYCPKINEISPKDLLFSITLPVKIKICER